MNKNPSLLVFTDLDGTLLDHKTYAFEPARPAIAILREKAIPLILCSSKTRVEIEEIREALQNAHPFIAENGAVVFIPRWYFTHPFSFHKEERDYLVIELGTPYPKLREVLKRMKKELPCRIRGFGDMGIKEVAELTRLSLAQAELAKKREYDEPFLMEGKEAEGLVREMAGRFGLQVTRGGRFFHLLGGNDKGKAVRRLIELYGKEGHLLQTLGVGDSLNDLPMLAAVNHPILVQKPKGGHDPAVRLDNLVLAKGPGPQGWNQAVLEALEKLL